MVVAGVGGGELSGAGPGAPCPPLPTERPAPRPQHKAVPGLGCPDSRVHVLQTASYADTTAITLQTQGWTRKQKMLQTSHFLDGEIEAQGLETS